MKKWLCIVLSLLMVLSMTACGAEEDTTLPNNQETQDQPILENESVGYSASATEPEATDPSAAPTSRTVYLCTGWMHTIDENNYNAQSTTYDQNGNPLKIEIDFPCVTEVYDEELDLYMYESGPIDGLADYVYEMSYDPYGNLQSYKHTYHNHEEDSVKSYYDYHYTYSYNSQGKIETCSQDFGSVLSVPDEWKFNYHNGYISSVEHYNALGELRGTAYYSYDQDGRILSEMQHETNRNTSYTYSYDDVGNLTAMVYSSEDTEEKTSVEWVNTRTYNDHGLLQTSVWRDDSGTDQYVTRYSYKNGMLHEAQMLDRSGGTMKIQYILTFDENGCLTKRTRAYDDDVIYFEYTALELSAEEAERVARMQQFFQSAIYQPKRTFGYLELSTFSYPEDYTFYSYLIDRPVYY